MTRKQRECFVFIAKYLEEHGVSPNMDEIAAGIGIASKGSVHRYIDILEEAGFIRRVRLRARSIQLIDPGEVKLNDEIFQLVQKYAQGHRIGVDTAANELLRQVLGAAA